MIGGNNSALSGGLLVVLGILVAVGLYYVINGGFEKSGPEIKVELPKVDVSR